MLSDDSPKWPLGLTLEWKEKLGSKLYDQMSFLFGASVSPFGLCQGSGY